MQLIRSCQTCGVRYTANEKVCPDDGSEIEESSDELLGTTIGNYRIVRMLGEGGMGQVYLALHPRIGSRVAVKVLSELATSDSALVERFFSEAHSVNKIRHEGIVNVLDLAHLPDGRPFITMEHLLGEPLNVSLQRGPLALGTAAGIIIEILDALQAAHDAGVIHRDLKPDNLFISPQGRVKILDFGVAKLMPHYETSLAKAATQTGALIGTPGYMSPEQVLGDPVTTSSDLYSVGAILYEMLTGQMAFRGTSLFELLNQIVNDAPMPPTHRRPELAGPYQDFIVRALAKNPADRHGSAREMAADLQAIAKLLGPRDWTPVRGLAEPSAHPMQADTAALTGNDFRRGLSVGNAPTQREHRTGYDGSTPPAGLIDATRGLHSVAAHDTANQTMTSRPSRWPLALALMALLGGGVSAVVLGSGAAKTNRAVAVAGDAGNQELLAEVVASAELPVVGGSPAESAPAESTPAESTPAKPPKEVTKPAPKTGGSKGQKPAQTPPNSQSTTPARQKYVKENGDVVQHIGGVTLIETGNRHKDKNIHRAPDFNPKAFDARRYLPKARALAKQIYPDSYLVEFDVPGVAPSGSTNLQLADFEATYNFLSPAHSARTLPIGIDEDRPCWIYVEVNKKGVTARIVERDECKGRRRPNPKCSQAEVWKRALEEGAPASGAVADLDYLHDGWFFSIDALDIATSIPDDC